MNSELLNSVDLASYLNIPIELIIIVIIWTLVWKGLALWKAGRKNQPIWFVAMLIVNTLGILEILYIFVFSKMGGKKAPEKMPVKIARRRKR